MTHEDAGLYRIILENDHGRVEATARLDVLRYRSKHGITLTNCSIIRFYLNFLVLHYLIIGSFRTVRSSSVSPRASPFYSKRLQNTTARVGSKLRLNAELRYIFIFFSLTVMMISKLELLT